MYIIVIIRGPLDYQACEVLKGCLVSLDLKDPLELQAYLEIEENLVLREKRDIE